MASSVHRASPCSADEGHKAAQATPVADPVDQYSYIEAKYREFVNLKAGKFDTMEDTREMVEDTPNTTINDLVKKLYLFREHSLMDKSDNSLIEYERPLKKRIKLEKARIKKDTEYANEVRECRERYIKNLGPNIKVRDRNPRSTHLPYFFENDGFDPEYKKPAYRDGAYQDDWAPAPRRFWDNRCPSSGKMLKEAPITSSWDQVAE
jgi:hypothetical protein